MKEIIYDNGDFKIYKINSCFWVRYDAGAHQVEMREDEISESEAKSMMVSEANATEVLFAIQKRLKAAGVNPYKTNI